MRIQHILPAVLLVLAPAQLSAESITLQAFGSQFAVTGELLEFDGDVYVIRAALGELRMPADSVSCVAGACPPGTAVATVRPQQADPVETPPATVAAAPAAIAPDPVALAGIEAPIAVAPQPETTTPRVASVTQSATLDESRIRMGGDPAFLRELAPLMVETWGFLDQRDFGQSGPADARVLLLSGGGRDPLDIELINSDRTELPDFLESAFVDVVLAGDEFLDEVSDVDFSVIGLDAAAFITTRDNPINAISMNDLAGILSGQISNWNAVGGPDLPIRLMVPSNEASTAGVIAARLLAATGATLSPNAQRVESESALADAVARERGAIGLINFANLRNAKPLSISDSCGLRTAPNEFAIKAGDYPLTRRIMAITPAGRASNSTRGLLDFMTGTMAERTLVNAGLVALSPADANIGEQGLRFAQISLDPSTRGGETQIIEFTQNLIDAQRLSLTLRAGDLANGLDSRGNDDMRRLATLIAANRFNGREIMLVGFSDSARTAAESVALSAARADIVANALTDAIGTIPAGVRISSVGYGHIAPLACNADQRGAIVNNRIEVWVRALN